MSKRLALMIGNAEFDDPLAFPNLRTPGVDARDFAEVLRSYGRFEITGILVNERADAITNAIEDLFSQAEQGDLTLLFYSGHGYRDLASNLYLAARNTNTRKLLTTAIPDSFIQNAMYVSKSHHRVIILDCCYSGVFIQGQKAGSETIPLEKLKGEATSILASSGRVQFSFEEGGQHSLFTEFLIEGIHSGQADKNRDGLVEVDELFQFADQKVRQVRPEQTPMIENRIRDTKIVIAEIPQEIVRDRELAELYHQARAALQKQDWREVIRLFGEIQAKQEHYPDPEGLLAAARRGLDEQRLRARHFALMEEARAAMSAGEWQAARDTLAEIITLAPQNSEAKLWLEQVNQAIAGEEERARLPVELLEAVKHPSSNIRLGAVADLSEFLTSQNARLVQLALEQLRGLAESDDSKRVSSAAKAAIDAMRSATKESPGSIDATRPAPAEPPAVTSGPVAHIETQSPAVPDEQAATPETEAPSEPVRRTHMTSASRPISPVNQEASLESTPSAKLPEIVPAPPVPQRETTPQESLLKNEVTSALSQKKKAVPVAPFSRSLLWIGILAILGIGLIIIAANAIQARLEFAATATAAADFSSHLATISAQPGTLTPVNPTSSSIAPLLLTVSANHKTAEAVIAEIRAGPSPTVPAATQISLPNPEAVIPNVEKGAEISVWTFWLSPTFDNYIKSTIERFEKVYPGVHVRWEDHQVNFLDDLKTAFAAESAPDVINLSVSEHWVSNFAGQGKLLSLDDRIPQNVKDLYFPGLWDMQLVNGAHYQFPYYQSMLVELINTQIYNEKYGFKIADFPRTVDGLPALCRQVQQKTGKKCAIHLDVFDLLSQMAYEGNVKVISADGSRFTFDSAEAVNWLNLYVQMVKDGSVDGGILVTDRSSNVEEQFTSGQAPFFKTSPQLIRSLHTDHPDLYGSLASVPVPLGKSGFLGKGLMAMSVSASTRYPNAAIALAQFMTNSQSMLAFAKEVAVYPGTPSSFADPFFTQPSPAPEDSTRLLAKDTIARYAEIVPPIPNQTAVNDIVLKHIRNALNGSVDAQKALTDAVNEANALAK